MQINKRIKGIVIMGVLVAGLMMSGCGSKQAAPPPVNPEVAIVTVNPERVLLTTELPGRTSAYFVAEIRPAKFSIRSIPLPFKQHMTMRRRTSLSRGRLLTGRGLFWK
jgi:hypothetical protein